MKQITQKQINQAWEYLIYLVESLQSTLSPEDWEKWTKENPDYVHVLNKAEEFKQNKNNP